MSNRVEELESHVAELQAAVDGLTEELVETRERLRSLEADADVGTDAGGVPGESVTPGGAEDSTTGATDDPGTEADTDAGDAPAEADPATDDGASSDSDDIIVA